MFKYSIIILSLFLANTFCFYTATGPVILLDSNNFQKEVVESKDIWLIEFYASWCGHCRSFAPEYEKAAKALKGIFKIGAIDADKNRDIGSKYQIKGFPTVKFFGENKNSPEDYTGGRTANEVSSFMFEKARKLASSRMGGSSSEKKSTSSNSDQKKTTGGTGGGQPASDKDVIILNDNNFDEVVYSSNDMWIVTFYAPWCGHCQHLLPEYNQAASRLKGQIKLAKVDATQNNKLSQRFGIRGYPTIKIFKPGPGKSDSNAEDYNGPRDATGIVQYALNKLEGYGFVPTPVQLINHDILKETCMDKTGICIIVFLPHIADSNAKERNKYIDQIKEASKAGRGKPIYFLWAQGGDFFDFEDKMHLSFGYPAVIAFNYNKKKFAVCRRAFNTDNLKDFILNIFLGKELLTTLPEFKPLKKVDKWDGKDYTAPPPPKDDDL